MANTSRLRGFRPVRHLSGAPYNGQANIYEIPAGDSTATFIGDLMKTSDQDSSDFYPAAERAGTSGEITSGLFIGAVIGFVVLVSASGASPTLDTPIYRVGSTKRFALIADSPDLIYEVQDGDAAATPKASIGLNVGFMATAGSTVTGLSGMTTGTTAATTTNTLPLRVMGIVNSPDNEPDAVSQKLLVMIQSHQYVGAQTAV